VEVISVITTASIGAHALINATFGGTGQTITIGANQTLDLRSGAGGLGGAMGTAGIGAGVVVQVVTQDVTALVGAGSTVRAGGNIAIGATLTEDVLDIAASAAASSGTAGVSASLVVLVLTNNVRAQVASTQADPTTMLARG